MRNKETVKAVLEIFQKEFDAEDGRNKHIESKVQMMLTLSGILVSAIVLLFKTVLERNMWIKFNASLLIISLGLTVWAVMVFLGVIRARTFQKINHDRLLDVDVLEMEPEDVEWNVACDYKSAINENYKIIEEKGALLKSESRFIKYAVIVFNVVCLSMLLKSILCEGNNEMSKDSATGAKDSTKVPSAPRPTSGTGISRNSNESSGGGGFGTMPVTKGASGFNNSTGPKKNK